MNRKRLRAVDEAVVATASSNLGRRQGHGRGQNDSRNNHNATNGKSKRADQTLMAASEFGNREQRRGRGYRGGHGRRRKKATQREEAEEVLNAKLKKCMKTFIACRDQSEGIEGPFEGRWKLWSPDSSEDRTCRPLFTAVETTMQEWANKSLNHWAMAERMVIWSVGVEYRQTRFLEQHHPGFGESICIRPWFVADEDGIRGWDDPAYLVKAWVGQGREVVIGLSEEDEIPLIKLLDEMAARHFLGKVCDDVIWRYWAANNKKFNWAGLPDEIKLKIMGHLIQEKEIRPYEKPMGRGPIARGEQDPPPEVATSQQIREGLWWVLPGCHHDYLWMPPINMMVIDLLLASNLFCFENPQALRRFLKNMGPAAQKVRKIKLHFQYEDFLMLFRESSLPLATDRGEDNSSRLQMWHESSEAMKTILGRLRELNLTEFKIHVRKAPTTHLKKLAHYGFVAWEFGCHRSMHIYIFRQMAALFAHVRKLGVEFAGFRGDATIHDVFTKIHRDAMNHPEGELRISRRAREEARLLEIRGEKSDGSDGGVGLPHQQPELRVWEQLGLPFSELERTHDPVVWRDGAKQRSNFIFPCTAHPRDRCDGRNDCIFGAYTPGRRREAAEKWEPLDEDDARELEEWEAAQAAGGAQDFDNIYDDRPASYPSFSPWLDPDSLRDGDGSEGE